MERLSEGEFILRLLSLLPLSARYGCDKVKRADCEIQDYSILSASSAAARAAIERRRTAKSAASGEGIGIVPAGAGASAEATTTMTKMEAGTMSIMKRRGDTSDESVLKGDEQRPKVAGYLKVRIW